MRGLKTLKSIADSRPKTVKRGACQEIVLRGDEVDLGRLPVQTCWPGDAGPFITLPAVITRDPRTGQRNVGMYRMQVLGPRSTAMHWQIHKDGRADYLFTEGRMEVAVALGLDPITRVLGERAAAEAHRRADGRRLPARRAGGARARASPSTSRCPRTRRSCSRATSTRASSTAEGPFGDHTGYYTPAEQFPVFNVTAITMRRDAIYPSIVVGKPPQEDAWLGKATERIFLPAVKMTVPEIVDYDLPVAGAFHNLCIVSIRKAFPGHARKVMHAIWGLGMLSLTKGIVVVDEHVDVHDYARGDVLRRRERRSEARHRDHRGPARPPRPRADAAVHRRQDRDRRDGEGPARGRPRVAAGDRDERRDARRSSTAAGTNMD